MQLTLTDRDVAVLREALLSYLPELRMEIARTDSKDYREPLLERERLFDRLVAELERAVR
jgi:hypothetical protein